LKLNLYIKKVWVNQKENIEKKIKERVKKEVE